MDELQLLSDQIQRLDQLRDEDQAACLALKLPNLPKEILKPLLRYRKSLQKECQQLQARLPEWYRRLVSG
jgi:hypothetical protein